MNTKIRLILCGLALGVPAAALLRADPGSTKTVGRVLILEGDRTLEGEIQREGEDYLIRRPVGEVWISGEKVRKLCANWQEAYAYVRSQANLGDPDERIRLLHWCQLHNLRKEALAEATAAVELRPGDAEARRLKKSLRRTLAEARVNSPRKPAHAPVAPVKALAPVDLSAESMSGFTTLVQPILMNACANCHTGRRTTSFQLRRAYAGVTLGRLATQQNLAAVVAQIDRERPQLSPLLVKAVSTHGGANQAPLKGGRQTPAFRHLEEWVETTLADNPQLLEEAKAERSAGQGEKHVVRTSDRHDAREDTEQVGSFQPAVPAYPGEPTTAPIVAMTGPALRAAAKTASTPPPQAKPMVLTPPKRPPTPVDPFDPLIFNREMHPEK
jgi:hypothetical protein